MDDDSRFDRFRDHWVGWLLVEQFGARDVTGNAFGLTGLTGRTDRTAVVRTRITGRPCRAGVES